MDGLSQKWTLYFANRRSPEAIARIQRQRLDQLVDYAKNNSPFYSRIYQNIAAPIVDLRGLPVVTKPQLMDCFDQWVTDPQITLQDVHQFISNQHHPTQRIVDRYSVWITSGTTGEPGIFLQDSRAQSIYNDLILFRAYPAWLNLRQLFDLVRLGFRYTLIIATGGPYAGVSSWEQVRQRLGRFRDVLSTLSIDHPMPELVRQLNEIQPVVLSSYPSMLYLLALEQLEGSLNIHPEMLAFTGEWIEPEGRRTIESAFSPGRLVELYGASEFPYLATSCRQNWLHLNADWAILEPVDQHGQPVPPGQPSHSVLLTNLANYVQPIIRYDLGDSLTLRPDPCPCGSRLPALRVEGRHDEILAFPGADGRSVHLLPMAMAEQVEITPGVRRYQIIQTARNALQLRIEAVPGSDPRQVSINAAQALRTHLRENGLPDVTVSLEDQLPHPDPASGKYRLVWSEIKDYHA